MDARRPRFAEGFPRTPMVDALVEAFARGDFAQVRAAAPALASSEDAAVRDAAQVLLDRTHPDPLAVRLMWIAAALLLVLTAWWTVHGKAPAGPTPASQPAPRARP